MSRPTPGPLNQFDSAFSDITELRGGTYGHPAENFANTVGLVAGLPHYSDPRHRHIALMICVKLCRLAADPTHVDSLVDIAGYSRTWAMILDKEQSK